MTSLDVLLAPPGSPASPPTTIGDDPAEALLQELYAYPPRAAGGWVRANMVSSVDGAATGADERSGSINGPADLRVFTTLRALADVVLVGAGTVRAEGYRAPEIAEPLRSARLARGRSAAPALAIVSARGDVPTEVLRGGSPPWVFTTDDAPGVARLRAELPSDHLHVHPGTVDLARVRTTLVAAGLPAILTEGGPSLLGTLLAAGLVDELCLTTSPQLVGGPAPRPVAGIGWLSPPARLGLAHLLHCEGVLLGRWLVEHQ
ncbi:MAG TPA: dihydrofolate reductase family protein [Actinotalea sp.]